MMENQARSATKPPALFLPRFPTQPPAPPNALFSSVCLVFDLQVTTPRAGMKGTGEAGGAPPDGAMNLKRVEGVRMNSLQTRTKRSFTQHAPRVCTTLSQEGTNLFFPSFKSHIIVLPHNHGPVTAPHCPQREQNQVWHL